MREYAIISPRFWTGDTGRKLRAHGKDAVIVANYLVTGPHANMLGLYYLPKPLISHETPCTIEEASKALQCCIEVGFCVYDEATECVFIPEMASWQIDETLKANDKRVAGIQKQFNLLPKTVLLKDFFHRYHEAFHLDNTRGIEAPPKPGAGTGAEAGTGLKTPAAFELEGGSTNAVAITLPMTSGDYPVAMQDVEVWKELYPSVPDVMQSLRNLKGWLLADKSRLNAKPTSLRSRITTWLKTDNDDAVKRGLKPRAAKRDYHQTGGMTHAGGKA